MDITAEYMEHPKIPTGTTLVLAKRAVCKNIAELDLDHRQAIDSSVGGSLANSRSMWAGVSVFIGIECGVMTRLTTLVPREVMLEKIWIYSIFKSHTFRRLHLHTCWWDGWG
jgi:hypothetical protein